VNSEISDRTAAKNYQSQYVASLFNSIASTYDFLNHFLSGGIDFYWRRHALKMLGNPFPKNVLDVATGTGDFAIAAAKLGTQKIVGIDIADNMLAIGRNKIKKRNLEDKITLETGKSESMQFSDNSFDAAIVAFGVRNFENLELGLSEMRRVLKKDAKILVLEFSKPKYFPFKQIYLLYFKHILPLIGKLISKHKEAYDYLPNTVMNFPEGEIFLGILTKVGFKNTQQRRMTFGIVTAYTGVKL
jgi:demethylmenaquinone methyltransferase/2-methoxy-6-polyprenyl-1,4-benzoquinol methylase